MLIIRMDSIQALHVSCPGLLDVVWEIDKSDFPNGTQRLSDCLPACLRTDRQTDGRKDGQIRALETSLLPWGSLVSPLDYIHCWRVLLTTCNCFKSIQPSGWDSYGLAQLLHSKQLAQSVQWLSCSILLLLARPRSSGRKYVRTRRDNQKLKLNWLSKCLL